MFAALFGKTSTEAADVTRSPALYKLRAGYDDWRFRRDIAAIMAALDRLSDRRLDLIGVRREALFDSVSEMMLRAADERSIADEVIAMLDRAPQGQKPQDDLAPARDGKVTVAA